MVVPGTEYCIVPYVPCCAQNKHYKIFVFFLPHNSHVFLQLSIINFWYGGPQPFVAFTVTHTSVKINVYMTKDLFLYAQKIFGQKYYLLAVFGQT